MKIYGAVLREFLKNYILVYTGITNIFLGYYYVVIFISSKKRYAGHNARHTVLLVYASSSERIQSVSAVRAAPVFFSRQDCRKQGQEWPFLAHSRVPFDFVRAF